MRPAIRSAAAAASAAAVLLLSAASVDARGPSPEYAALGDSYSSGVGAGSYADGRCLRSASAYPVRLAAEQPGGFGFEACSGARTEDLLAEQLDALGPETRLVTVGIGGNDIGWGTVVGACMAPESLDCGPLIDRAEAAIADDLPALLDRAYTAIAELAPHAEVYVLGYPRLFDESEPCASIPDVTVEEQAAMNASADLLAAVVATAAEAHDFIYVDVRETFEGHAICDPEPWIHGYTGTVDSFHPNAAGQEGYYSALALARA